MAQAFDLDSTGVPPPFEHFVNNPLLYDAVFDYSSPATILRFLRTCRSAQLAVTSYMNVRFDINRQLLRFYDNPRGFRSLQAHTGTLISGSTALQFFDRTFYPSADLDIYCETRHSREVGNLLLNAGYRFKPGRQQTFDFHETLSRMLQKETSRYPSVDSVTICGPSDDETYFMRGVSGVCNFIKSANDGSELKVQLIAAWYTPLEIILQFHSTCVMNIISWERAYSLFPRATFEERRSLLCATAGPAQEMARTKYKERGWIIELRLRENERTNTRSSFRVGFRRIGDKYCWALPLDTEGLRLPVSLPPATSSHLFCDNLAMHTWELEHPPTGLAGMKYYVLLSPVLEYNYVIQDPELYNMVYPVIQGIEEKRVREQRLPSWERNHIPFYDLDLNRICQNFFETKDNITRTLEALTV